MKSKPDISFIIPAFNEEKHIAKCLTAIVDCHPLNLRIEVVVVDNGSVDNTVQVAESFENVRVLKLSDVNVGAVRNFGAENSSASILAFIDADCLITENWIEAAYKLCSERPGTVFGGGCKLTDNPTWVEKYWLLEKGGKPTMPKHLIGASIVLERSVFKDLGGFKEDVTSGEDSMLSEKVVERRYNLKIVPELTVIHLGNALTLKEFFARQIWHSENYLKKPLSSLKDPVFMLISFFGLFAMVSASLGIMSHPFFWPCLFVTIVIPAILSIKRIFRAKILEPKIILVFPQVYTLDFIYVIARLFGLLKSLRTV